MALALLQNFLELLAVSHDDLSIFLARLIVLGGLFRIGTFCKEALTVAHELIKFLFLYNFTPSLVISSSRSALAESSSLGSESDHSESLLSATVSSPHLATHRMEAAFHTTPQYSLSTSNLIAMLAHSLPESSSVSPSLQRNQQLE